MAGGRLEIALEPLATPASYGVEQVEFRVASHPKQPLGPLAKVASGGELSRIALAIQVVTSEVGEVPTLIFDEVDAGIGGAVAATVGELLQALGARRQVLCVTHLPQVAAFADAHFRVTKHGDATAVRADVEALARATESRSSRGCSPAARSPRRRARTRRSSSSGTGGNDSVQAGAQSCSCDRRPQVVHVRRRRRGALGASGLGCSCARHPQRAAFRHQHRSDVEKSSVRHATSRVTCPRFRCSTGRDGRSVPPAQRAQA